MLLAAQGYAVPLFMKQQRPRGEKPRVAHSWLPPGRAAWRRARGGWTTSEAGFLPCSACRRGQQQLLPAPHSRDCSFASAASSQGALSGPSGPSGWSLRSLTPSLLFGDCSFASPSLFQRAPSGPSGSSLRSLTPWPRLPLRRQALVSQEAPQAPQVGRSSGPSLLRPACLRHDGFRLPGRPLSSLEHRL